MNTYDDKTVAIEGGFILRISEYFSSPRAGEFYVTVSRLKGIKKHFLNPQTLPDAEREFVLDAVIGLVSRYFEVSQESLELLRFDACGVVIHLKNA